jgi:hypothetical protein
MGLVKRYVWSAGIDRSRWQALKEVRQGWGSIGAFQISMVIKPSKLEPCTWRICKSILHSSSLAPVLCTYFFFITTGPHCPPVLLPDISGWTEPSARATASSAESMPVLPTTCAITHPVVAW